MSTAVPPDGPQRPATGASSTSEDPGAPDRPKSKASALFDLRTLIGALFTLYGIVLIVASFFTSDAQLHKADDIDINLWLGIGMLVLGLFFLAWFRLRPLQVSGTSAQDQLEGGAAPPGGH